MKGKERKWEVDEGEGGEVGGRNTQLVCSIEYVCVSCVPIILLADEVLQA